VAVFYAADGGFAGWEAGTVAAGTGGNYHAGGAGTLGFFDVSEGDGKWKLLVPQNFEYAGGLTLGLRSIALGSSTAAGARLTFGSETDLTVLGQFAVAHGSTVDFGGGTVASVGTLTVAGTSTIICRGLNTGEQVGSVWAGEGVTIAAGTLSVEAGSAITADGQGYAGGAGGGNNGLGPGGGIYTGGPWRQGGGGHGGAGGHAANGGTGGAACGSAFEPADLGSGGSSDDSSNEAGGPGGGAIRLDVSGTFSLDGTVTANGERPGNDIGAGGAGGSIWVTCGTLAGSGCFQADGAGRHYNEGAGGAGGRVAVYYATDGGFGGFAASTAAAGASCYAAERGSVIFLDTSIPDWHLWIYRDLVLGADTEMTLGAVTVTNAGRLVIGGGSTISVRGAFVVTGSSTVVCRGTNTSAQVDGQWAGQGVRINAGSMTVAAGSTITADGQGYAGGAGGGNNGAGPGGGIYTGGPWTCAGGGYGGAGGHAANGGTGGATYGSAFQPTYLGSGGSSDDSGNEAGGPGGGAIRLVIRDTFTLDGTVTANGARPANDIGAGGAGGSIWVTTNVLTGGGYFRADGASRGPHTEGAGGGGGRIAVDYADAASFGGQASSTAAAGASRYAAEAGTVNFLLRSGEADLVVVEYPTAVPDHAGAGDAVDVGWEVRNQWPGAATAAWTDGVYLSLDDKLDGSDILLATAAATPLNGSESYTRALSVTIPDVPAGEYFLLFAADIWDEQTETVEDNNAAAIAFTVLSGSLPDIEVVQVGAPGLAFWGGRIDVWWRAVNHGPAIAAASWFDGVYLSADELLDASDVQIASARSLEFLPLDAGEEYRQDLPDVEVPIDQAAGMHYLLFVADPYGTLAEADETNNVCAVAIDLPGADLTVAQAAAPASASPGETIAVSWMVANAGDGDALGDWLDRVYLSDDDALDGGDVLLATRDQAARSPLTGTTGQYGDSADVTVPLDAGAGKHWLLLVTDAAATQPETLEDNNVLAVELDVLMPDLRIVATAPAQASWGQTISVSWTVTNDGPGRAMADWTDRVWLCAAAAKDGSEVQIRAVAVTSQTPLDDAGSYTIDADITLPAPSLDGQVYLLFTADDGNAQPEGDEGNNLAAVEIALRGPDLAFSGGSAVPDVLAMGDVVALQWTVANVGLGAAMGSWQDRAYLSRDQAVSADDWRLGALAAGTTPLPAVDDYTSGIEVTIPNLAVGTWYFLVAADSAGALSETGELNNLLAVPVTVVDRLGPYVASWSPAGPLNTDVASLRVVFSEAVLPGSFTAADVTVDGPGGTVDGADITVTPVDDVTFDIAFPARTADGTYSVTIGPDVTDLAGNPLSRAAYATDFEAGAGAEWSDATTSDGGAALSRFLGDFANLTDTLALADLPAHSGVTMLWDLFIIDSWDGNTGGVGPDWWGLNVSGRPAPEVERTFSIFDRNNQTYGGNPDQTGNFYRGGWSEDLYRDVGLVFPHSGGELSLGFYGRNLQGVGDESWGIDNLRVLLTDPVGVANVATFVIERTGPSVTDCQPGDPAVAPLDHFDVTFSEPINAATFGADDVTLTGPAGDIPVNQPVLVSGNTYRVSFAAQMTGGTYTLTVGPAVEDLAGNEMNQDGDAVNGEDPADAFGASVLLTAANLAIAPGAAPVEASWGQTITVTWTVTNTGDGPALADWGDRVYLSADQSVDAGDRLLWTADQAEHSPLAGNGGSYEASADVTMPADLATGRWYLLLVADDGDAQAETD